MTALLLVCDQGYRCSFHPPLILDSDSGRIETWLEGCSPIDPYVRPHTLAVVILPLHGGGTAPAMARSMREELPAAGIYMVADQDLVDTGVIRAVLDAGVDGVVRTRDLAWLGRLAPLSLSDRSTERSYVRRMMTPPYEQTGASRIGAGRDDGSGDVNLTPREQDVLYLLRQGKTNNEIAAVLFISKNTVKSYCRSIFWKLEARNRTAAAVLASTKTYPPSSDWQVRDTVGTPDTKGVTLVTQEHSLAGSHLSVNPWAGLGASALAVDSAPVEHWPTGRVHSSGVELSLVSKLVSLLDGTDSALKRASDALDALCEAVDAEGAYIRVLDDRQEGLRKWAHSRIHVSGVDVQLAPPVLYFCDGSLASRVYKTGRSVLCYDFRRQYSAMAGGLLVNVRAALCTPLSLNGEIFGVLGLNSSRPGSFKKSLVATVEFVVAQIAPHFYRAWLVTEVERRIRKLAALNEQSWGGSGSLALSRVLRRTKQSRFGGRPTSGVPDNSAANE